MALKKRTHTAIYRETTGPVIYKRCLRTPIEIDLSCSISTTQDKMADVKQTDLTDTKVEEARARPESSDEKSSIDEVANAKDATDAEHATTVRQGLKAYKKAIFWSVIFSLCIVMDGYDVSMLRRPPAREDD